MDNKTQDQDDSQNNIVNIETNSPTMDVKEVTEEKTIDNGEKSAKIGRILFFISIATIVITFVLFKILGEYAKVNNIPTDDTSGFGWTVGFFVLLPGFAIAVNTFLAGLIFSIIAELEYRKYLKEHRKESLSKKRMHAHIFSIAYIIITILVLCAFEAFRLFR